MRSSDLRTIASLPTRRFTNEDTYKPEMARARAKALDLVMMSNKGLCRVFIVWVDAARKKPATKRYKVCSIIVIKEYNLPTNFERF